MSLLKSHVVLQVHISLLNFLEYINVLCDITYYLKIKFTHIIIKDVLNIKNNNFY